MDRDVAAAALHRPHTAQNSFYSGGDSSGLREVLTKDVVWCVPGANAIADVYRGIDDVLEYMRGRRAFAAGTFQLHPRDLLTGDGGLFAMHTDGTATIDGEELTWPTIGLYRLTGQ